MNFQTLKNNYIKGLLETNALSVKGIDEEPFTLKNGNTSYILLDQCKLGQSPKAYRAFIDVLLALIFDIYGEQKITLCNTNSEISAHMVGSLAYIANYPQICYQSDEIQSVENPTDKTFSDNYDLTDQIAIIDDGVFGENDSIKRVGDTLNKAYPNNTGIRIFVGFVPEIQPTPYPVHQIVTRTELMQNIWNGLTKKQQEAIEKETAIRYYK